MSDKRIHDSLNLCFHRQSLVFWYHPNGEWMRSFDSFESEGIQKIEVGDNEFAPKVRVLGDVGGYGRVLLYFASTRHQDHQNWLLDLCKRPKIDPLCALSLSAMVRACQVYTDPAGGDMPDEPPPRGSWKSRQSRAMAPNHPGAGCCLGSKACASSSPTRRRWRCWPDCSEWPEARGRVVAQAPGAQISSAPFSDQQSGRHPRGQQYSCSKQGAAAAQGHAVDRGSCLPGRHSRHLLTAFPTPDFSDP